MALGTSRFALALLALVSLVSASQHANQQRVPTPPFIEIDALQPVVSLTGAPLAPYNTTYYFDQLIDHNDASKGTFKQRYWHTAEYYKKGGCIIIMTPGEGNADGMWISYTWYVYGRLIIPRLLQLFDKQDHQRPNLAAGALCRCSH